MPGYFSADYLCPACGLRWNEIVERDKRDEFHTCPDCGEPSPRTVGAPRIMNASLPDGQRKMSDVREEHAMEMAEVNENNPKKRAEIAKQRRKEFKMRN